MSGSQPVHPHDSRLPWNARRGTAVASLAVLLFGCLGLAGWVLQAPSWPRALERLPLLAPNTAVCFILTGLALWLQRTEEPGTARRRVAQGCAALAVVLGLLTVIEYLSGWEAGIDLWLFREALQKSQKVIPGRMAILTAVNFSLLGLALLRLDTKPQRLGFKAGELCTVTALLIALLGLIGYVCAVPIFYGWRTLFPNTGMALSTVTAFLVLGVGLLCARPAGGLVELVTSRSVGGLMARWLLLAPVIIPLTTGWLKLLCQRSGIYNAELAGWLLSFLNIFVFTLAIWGCACLLHRSDAVRLSAQDDLRQLNARLEHRVNERTVELSQTLNALRESEERARSVLDAALDAVVTADDRGRITSWNREAERIFGWTRQEMLGQTLSDTIIPPRHREAHERGLQHFLATQEGPALNRRIELTALRRDGREFPVELAITPIRLGEHFIFSAFISDITERKRVEETRAHLAAIVACSDDAILSKTLDGIITSWNPGAERMFGYAASEVVGKPMLMLFPKDRIGEEADILARIRRGERIDHFESVRIRKDGKPIDISATISPIRDSQGQVVGVSKIARDTTERKQADEKLKSSLKDVNDLKAALDEHAIVAITTPQGRITYVNDKFCSISKYPREELIGQDHRLINSGYHSKEFIRDLWTTIARGRVWHGEIRNRAKDGSIYWVDTTIVPFLGADGKPYQYVAIRADITERKRAEEQLKSSLKDVGDLKAALDEHAIVAITNPQGRITYVNDKFCTISKYSRQELIGQDHRLINSGYHSKEFIRDLWTTIAQGRVWHGEIRNRAKDGSIYWVDTTIVPFLNADGKPYQYVAIRADITARKQAEGELRQLNTELEQRVRLRTGELETANRELEAFSYSVSHDLRAPLRHLLGFSQLLQTSAGPALDDKSRRYLDVISESVTRMGNLIDDLLEFSRMGRAEIRKTQLNLEDLVQEVIHNLSEETKGRHIDWRIDPLPVVQADRAMMRQALVNLLANAVKFTRTRERAEICIGHAKDDHQGTVISIRDNGVGFDMKYADKLFGVFQRLHRSEDFEGTGIGLANIRRIIQRHGGRTWAEGVLNEGATFYFSLPV